MDLCVACGLCCSGALFARVPLEPVELERVRARRLPLIEHEGRTMLPLPCPAHAGRCTLHPAWPGICERYECAVLSAVKEGELGEEAARVELEAVKALAASVRARVPGSGDLWTDVARFAEDSPAWRRAHAELLVDLAVLRTRLADIEPRAMNRAGALDDPA